MHFFQEKGGWVVIKDNDTLTHFFDPLLTHHSHHP